MAQSYEMVTSAERLGHIANEIIDSPCTGLDIETTGYDPDVKDSSSSPFRDEIRLMQVNTGKGVYVIDHFQTKTLDPVVKALGETKGVKVGQNLKFEQKFILQKYNTELWPIFDTYRASALTYNGKKLPHDLYSIYERELKLPPPTRDLGGSKWDGPLTPEQLDYAASDVQHLHRLRDLQKEKLSKLGLNKVALIEFGAVLPECAVELNGFPLDSQMWLDLAAENEIKAEELRKQLIWELPNPKQQLSLLGFHPDINLDSPTQMLASLRKLGIKQTCEKCRKGRTRDGDICPLCNGSTIVPLQNTREMTVMMHAAEYPIIRKFLEYRGYKKDTTSFGADYLEWKDATTGRLHPRYYPFTEAGRYSCIPLTSRVSTSRGIIPFGDVKVGDSIQTSEGPKRVLAAVRTGKKPLLRFNLEYGRKLECTGDHTVLCNGAWVQAKSVRPGDVLYMSGIEGPSASGLARLPEPNTAGGRKEIKFPKELDERLAFVLGHYIAEGCTAFNKQRPRTSTKNFARTAHRKEGERIPFKLILAFGHDEAPLREFLEKEYQELFGVTGTFKVSRKSGLPEGQGSPALSFSSMILSQWFIDIGCGGFSTEKRIPPTVFVSPAEVQLAFLRGLFEGDGSSANSVPGVCTDSPGLAQDVGELLAALGFLCSTTKTLRDNGNYKYTVYLLANSYKMSVEKPLFWSEAKQKGVREAKGMRGAGTVKPPFWDGRALYERAKNHYKWVTPSPVQSRMWKVCLVGKTINPDHMELFEPLLTGDTPTEEFIRWIDSANARSVEVYSVEDLPDTEVGDIEVEGAGSFLINSIVVHNCAAPNVQQIKREEAFRACFRPGPGKKLCMADYSNIEMRIIAELSKDSRLMQVFRNNEDAHYVTAASLMGISIDKVSKLQRQQAKPVNFGFCLAPGTSVLTSKGLKNIENMQVGDLVFTHMSRWKPVEACQVAHASILLRIATETGKVVECTEDHGWLTWDSDREETYKWTRAGELAEGQRLCSNQIGETEKIVSIDTILYEGKVYDITVKDDHSFIANYLVSHNSYGMMPPKMVLYAMANYGIALTLKQATEFRERFFQLYSRLPSWHRELLEVGERTQMSRNEAGRLRYMSEDAHNEYLNGPVQGLGAEGLKVSLRECYFRFKKYSPWNGSIKMIHHVHDEIITEIDDDPDLEQIVSRELTEGMQEGMTRFVKSVPVVVEAKSGPSWAAK